MRHLATWIFAGVMLLWATTACAQVGLVRLDTGMLEGVAEHDVLVYKGVPFARPPVGELRWRAPEPAEPWPGVRQADRFAPVCMQSGTYPPDAAAEPTSEDCLYLNLWRPADPAAGKLPVMVWIYGGGLENGSSSTPLYAGDRLARKGVIVVTLNYRLGVFGFLAHPELSRESPYHSSGNYGLLDQITALRWVQRNIAAFGGDPSRVTVFGQSSGAISISALTTSPLARGLFQRAIAESGGLFEPMSLSDDFMLRGAEQAGLRFARRARGDSIEALRRMPADQLLQIGFDPHLIVDGHALPEPPYDVYRAGRQQDVPLLVGFNRDEGSGFIAGQTITRENFRRELERSFPNLLVRLAAPDPGDTDETARNAAAMFHRDMRFRWDMWTWARLVSSAGRARVFLYEFVQVPPYRPGDRYFGWGAGHGMEMPYVFGHLDLQSLAWSAADRQLSDTMIAYWTNFAKTGNPNGPGLPEWPAFEPKTQQTMQLAERITQTAFGDTTTLRRLDRIYGTARFLQEHYRGMIAGAVLLLLAALVALGRRTRRRIASRAT